MLKKQNSLLDYLQGIASVFFKSRWYCFRELRYCREIIFFFEQAKQIAPFGKFFKGANKERNLWISYFFKGCQQNFRVQIPVIFGGRGRVKKWNVPTDLCVQIEQTLLRWLENLKHESNAIEFESKARPLKFYLLVQF